jgi:exonuclease SbcC
MRIHRLDITAFGPFAGEVSIDLDGLSGAGLFLLTGATGAGKTSVLDAVCFALYGAVPGDRQLAKRLRSDQAADGVAPAVTMELTVQGRRFRIQRSPAWERAKKRGEGLTTEQPHVLVEERIDGGWVPLASRLDEAGQLVSGLLGMTMTQFCQVQLLPQGRFQEFLRAESDDRRRLLQRLFRTSRFEDVERWLRDHRRSLRRTSADHHDRVADLVSRISEVASEPLPETWDISALEPVAEQLRPWAGRLCAQAEHAATTDDERATASEAAASEAARALDAGRTLRDRQRRLARARAERSALADEIPAHQVTVRRLESARRAESLLPLSDVASRATDEVHVAEQRVAQARAALLTADPDADPAPAGLADRAHRLTERGARVRAAQPRADERAQLQSLQVAFQRDLESVDAELAQVSARLEALPDEIAARRRAEEAARGAVSELEVVRAEATAVEQRLAAARQVVTLVAARREAEVEHRVAIGLAQDQKEVWLSLQERRLSGMAAEMAGALVVGGCCPVCGSADHPSLARPAPDAPDALAERAARKAVDDAEAVRHAHAGAVADLDAQLALTRERAGHRSIDELDREAADLTARVERLRDAAARLDDAVAGRADAEASWEELTQRRSELTASRARLETARHEHRTRIDEITRELADLVSDASLESLTALGDQLDALARACVDLDRAAADLDRCRAAERQAQEQLEEACRAHGFDSVAEARAATLPPEEVAELADAVRDREVRLTALEAELADPDLREARHAPAPDVAALDAAHRDCAAELAAARAAVSVSLGRAQRLATLGGELGRALAAWTPARDALDVADRLTSLVDGTSPDNRLKMRLSGYVLAFRLRQVVAAANERLVAMTDHRYRLEHSDDRGAGEARGGLSLRVRDDWSGETRDPVTLSGGETFVVSLALALGLADVIAHEAGGSELDTLFVDEGFGTLDADTLDDVMDTLDSLRDGGRVVGVVSHVAELRDRIPTQLHVRKHRSGSTVEQVAVG